MDAKQFAERLNLIAPSMEQLISIGLSKSDAEKMTESLRCEIRAIPFDIDYSNNQLAALMARWDVSKLEIGMIRFAAKPRRENGVLVVGRVEADNLVMEIDTGECFVTELNTHGHCLWNVAKDDKSLLDALAIAAEFLINRMLDKIDFSDMKTARRFADQCASLAGGDNYISFYLMLLGVE